MLRNWCFGTVVLEKTLESPLDCKETKSVLNIHWKGWCWRSNTLATWCKELTHWKRPWCWERLKAGGEGDDRDWGGWMASLTWQTWVWVSSGSWWWTERPGVLQFMGLQRVGHDWANELNWTLLPGMLQSTGLQRVGLDLATEQQLCFLQWGCLSLISRLEKKLNQNFRSNKLDWTTTTTKPKKSDNNKNVNSWHLLTAQLCRYRCSVLHRITRSALVIPAE